MIENLWRPTVATLRERYRRSALARYGVGLDCPCEDEPTARTEEIAVPRPRPAGDGRGTAVSAARSPGQAAQVS